MSQYTFRSRSSVESMGVSKRFPSAIGETHIHLVGLMVNCPLLLQGWPESGADLLRKCVRYGQNQSRLSAFISLELI